MEASLSLLAKEGLDYMKSKLDNNGFCNTDGAELGLIESRFP